MAYSLSSERPSVAAVTLNPFRAFFTRVAEARAKRARRLALSQLLELDASLLKDLGIEREDVIHAMERPDHAGRTLSARRAHSANDWLSHP